MQRTERIFALILLIVVSPVLVFFYVLVKLTSPGPFIFKQKRAGHLKKPFVIYKIRTMREKSDKLQHRYWHLKDVDGPVFKLFTDPRFTRVGKWLSKTGLDELPQLVNVIKGEMSFVGPRPLPINEARKISRAFKNRFTVLPGITSPWIIYGHHKLKYSDRMAFDLLYIQKRSLLYDLYVIVQTLVVVGKKFISY